MPNKDTISATLRKIVLKELPIRKLKVLILLEGPLLEPNLGGDFEASSLVREALITVINGRLYIGFDFPPSLYLIDPQLP